MQVPPLTATSTEYVILDTPNDQACPECVYMCILNGVYMLSERMFVIVVRQDLSWWIYANSVLSSGVKSLDKN